MYYKTKLKRDFIEFFFFFVLFLCFTRVQFLEFNLIFFLFIFLGIFPIYLFVWWLLRLWWFQIEWKKKQWCMISVALCCAIKIQKKTKKGKNEHFWVCVKIFLSFEIDDLMVLWIVNYISARCVLDSPSDKQKGNWRLSSIYQCSFIFSTICIYVFMRVLENRYYPYTVYRMS